MIGENVQISDCQSPQSFDSLANVGRGFLEPGWRPGWLQAERCPTDHG